MPTIKPLLSNFLLYLALLSLSISPPIIAKENPTPDKNPQAQPDSDAILMPDAPDLTQQSKKLLEEVNKRISNIDTKTLKSLLDRHPETILIDVRTPAELNVLGGHIDSPRHRNIIRGWLEFQVESLIPDKATPIVTYCGINMRSPLAADTLMKMGYTNVKNYADGFFAWKKAGHAIEVQDKDLKSFLYSRPVEVIPGVWSAIGATAPGTYANSGHNNNLSFIITEEGVVVMNAGDSYLLAQALHDEIKLLTDQPVKYVILENAQGHAAHGTGYWQAQGATVVIHKDAQQVIDETGHESLDRMRSRLRDKAYRTQLPKPDKVFEDSYSIQMGSWKIEVLYLGPAHSPGDILLWLPDKKLVIAGDMAFHERLLPVFEHTDTAGWIETWKKFEALGATTIIPGHGGATDMKTVEKWTIGYLKHIRNKVQEVIDNDGDLKQAYNVDQSAYSHLDTFDELAKTNAGTVFRSMEFE